MPRAILRIGTRVRQFNRLTLLVPSQNDESSGIAIGLAMGDDLEAAIVGALDLDPFGPEMMGDAEIAPFELPNDDIMIIDFPRDPTIVELEMGVKVLLEAEPL
ncbi:MAG TPA: hypothetical protein VMM76_08825 [Pirellulaceae bacterium]|nr:hypothetical protein [Pirellulaceae bacterium]